MVDTPSPGLPPGQPRVTVLRAALTCRCPRCGQGRLYRGVLSLRDECAVCHLDLRDSDVGDGTAVFVIMVLGAVIVGGAFWLEFTFSPPIWVHIIVWPIVTIPLAILMMRPLKAGLVASQYRNRSTEMGV